MKNSWKEAVGRTINSNPTKYHTQLNVVTCTNNSILTKEDGPIPSSYQYSYQNAFMRLASLLRIHLSYIVLLE